MTGDGGVSKQYERIRSVGTDGPFRVESAWPLSQRVVQQTVLLKRLRPDIQANHADQLGFVGDSMRMSLIVDPNIVQVLQAGMDDEGLFVVTEYTHGVSLSALLRRLKQLGKKMPQTHLVHLIREAIQGLERAHTRTAADEDDGVVHGNVSPDNLLLTFDGAVQLKDFGVHWLLRASGEAVPDRLGDVHAVGRVFHQLLAEFCTEVPDRELSAVVFRCIDNDPAERFQSASELLLALDTSLENLPGAGEAADIAEQVRVLFGAGTDRRTRTPATNTPTRSDEPAQAEDPGDAPEPAPDEAGLLDPASFWGVAPDLSMPKAGIDTPPQQPGEDESVTQVVLAPRGALPRAAAPRGVADEPTVDVPGTPIRLLPAAPRSAAPELEVENVFAEPPPVPGEALADELEQEEPAPANADFGSEPPAPFALPDDPEQFAPAPRAASVPSAEPSPLRISRPATTTKRRIELSTLLWLGLGIVALVIIVSIVWKVATRQPAESPGVVNSGSSSETHGAGDETTPPGERRPDVATGDPEARVQKAPMRGNIQVKVTSDPTGALVFVDGERRGATPTVIKGVAPDHEMKIRIEADGYRPWEQSYTFDRSSIAREIHAGLLHAGDCKTGAGWIYVVSIPAGATLQIDGKRMPGKTPLLVDNVCADKKHEVRVQALGHRAWRKQVTVESGKVLNLRAELKK